MSHANVSTFSRDSSMDVFFKSCFKRGTCRSHNFGADQQANTTEKPKMSCKWVKLEKIKKEELPLVIFFKFFPICMEVFFC